MSYRISYSRVGNAEPVYVIRSSDGQIVFAHSVIEVAAMINLSMKAVRIACREAREDGTSDYLV